MKEVTCTWCKSKGLKDEMHVEEKGTGKFNKNGTEKMSRKYSHKQCFEEVEKDKAFKKNELEEFDHLYQYLLQLHGVDVLDGRMIERLHDLRNGSVKVGNKKVKRYKEGVSFSHILKTYRYANDSIAYTLHNKDFENKKWNEFAYILSIVISKLNDVQLMLKQKEKQENQQRVIINKNIEMELTEPSALHQTKLKKKTDELDISSFL